MCRAVSVLQRVGDHEKSRGRVRHLPQCDLDTAPDLPHCIHQALNPPLGSRSSIPQAFPRLAGQEQITVSAHSSLTVLWDAAVSCGRGGDERGGGCGVGAQSLGLLRWHGLECAEGRERFGGTRRSGGQVRGGVGLRHSTGGQRGALSNGSGAGCEATGRWSAGGHVVSGCCCQENIHMWMCLCLCKLLYIVYVLPY